MKQDYYSIRRRNFISRTKEVLKEKGVDHFIKLFIKIIFGYYYYKIFRSSKTFTFKGKHYRYLYHMYHATWINERAVEIPIIWSIVKKYKNKNILEVGNVLSHYCFVNHDILDKYEKVKGVINQDVAHFKTYKKYDLIISISTLEHIGWDEIPFQPQKILIAFENLKRCLAKNGKIVVTLPLGQNPYMDKLIQQKKIKFSEKYCFKRVSENNVWIEVNWKNVYNTKYNSPFVAANGIVVGVIKN